MSRLRQEIFILGAAKSGTTTLAHWLARSHDIAMSQPKEPVFFEYEYHLGLHHYWDKYFSGSWGGESWVLDARHRNLFLPFIAARIEESVKHPHFLITLREPVQRAYAHWWHWRSRGEEPLSFEAAIELDRDRLERGIELSDDVWAREFDPIKGKNQLRTYLDSGFYAEQVRRYMQRFDRDRICVAFLDEWAESGAPLDGAVGSLPPDVVEGLGKVGIHANAGELGVYRGKLRGLESLRGSLAAKMAPQRMKERMKPLLLQRIEKPPMDAGVRRELGRVYAGHNRQLEQLLGRKVPSGWD